MTHPLDRDNANNGAEAKSAGKNSTNGRMLHSEEKRSRLHREQRLEEIRKEAEMHHRAAADGAATRKDFVPPSNVASATEGYYGMPALKTPAWTWEVPLYFFVGGAAGASALVASVGKLSGADRELVREARWLAAIGGAISPALLISDLGVPTRFLNMLRVFKVQSAMSVGSWTLVAFSSSAAAAAVLAEMEHRRARLRIPILSDMMEISSALSGMLLATYTGVLIGATAIPVWNRNVSLLPIHFATSGIAASASLLELRGHESKSLRRLAIAAAAIDTVVGASLELRRKPAMEPLHAGASGWTMRAAGLLSGPIPLALRLLASSSSKMGSRMRKAAAISAIAGSLVTRFAWIGAGKVSAKDPKVPLQLPGPAKSDEPPQIKDN
jgi:formate-dependent nitrite reductase membrane component NrfD